MFVPPRRRPSVLASRGDKVDRATQRRRTEQRALRTAQHFDALHVEGVDVGNRNCVAGLGERNFVDVITRRTLTLILAHRRADAANDGGRVAAADRR